MLMRAFEQLHFILVTVSAFALMCGGVAVRREIYAVLRVPEAPLLPPTEVIADAWSIRETADLLMKLMREVAS